VDEEAFDSILGAPEENGLWVEAIEGLSSAHQRMGQIPAEKPGEYFLFSRTDQSILTRLDTRSRTMFAR
jgi:hypothetical protein